MTNNTSVLNITRNYRVKHKLAKAMKRPKRILNVARNQYMSSKQALRAIDSCACAWVDYGVSVRDLSLSEAIIARNQQARLREPLALAELHNLHYRPAVGKEAEARKVQIRIRVANQFAAQVA